MPDAKALRWTVVREQKRSMTRTKPSSVCVLTMTRSLASDNGGHGRVGDKRSMDTANEVDWFAPVGLSRLCHGKNAHATNQRPLKKASSCSTANSLQ